MILPLLPRSLPALLTVCLVSLNPSLRAAPPQVEIETADITIEQSSTWETKVQLPAIPEGHRAILTFQAWYQAPMVAGYYRHMRLQWGNTPLHTLIDRPTFVQIARGQELDTVTEHGFLVPLLSDPETMRSDPRYMAQYRPVQEDEIDLSVFRFELPEADFPGETTLAIQNRARNRADMKYPTLIVRNLRVVFEPNSSGFKDR